MSLTAEQFKNLVELMKEKFGITPENIDEKREEQRKEWNKRFGTSFKAKGVN